MNTNYLIWLKNSVIITLGNIILSTSIAVLAGYGLARYDIKYKKYLANIFILAYMFAPIKLGIPYYMLFDQYGLLNSYVGIILAHSSITIPFSIWLMWQFFQTVPEHLEESAWVYGATKPRSLLEVAIPSAMPGIIACAIFAFAISWNDYTFSLILISDPSKTVLTLGLDQFLAGTEIYWDVLMTGAALIILPPIILVFTLNKYVLVGFKFGS